MISEFNKYTKNKNLDIKIKLNLFTLNNSTIYIDSYGSYLETILLKKNKNVDILIYDIANSPKFGPHLLDLKKYLPKEHIDLYKNDFNILSEGCSYKNKLVGLVNK